MGDEPSAHPLGDDLCIGVHHAGVDAVAGGTGPRRALDREPHRGGGVRSPRRAGDSAPRFGDVSAGVVAGPHGGVWIGCHADRHEEAHAHGQHVRHPVLDDAHPAANCVDRLRAAVRHQTQSNADSRAHRHWRVRASLALLPDQCFSRGRRRRGGAARFHAYPADCSDRLVALRRAPRCLRVSRRRPDRYRNSVELAQ